MKIETDSTGHKATGVTYIDANGGEVFQPANMVFLTAFAPNNVYMLLLSQIGRPYDPATGQGVIGKNYTYQSLGGATMYFEGKNFNPFMGSGSVNVSIDDWNGDNFDHAGLDFIGGGVTGCGSSGGRPVALPSGTARNAALGLRLESGGSEAIQFDLQLRSRCERARLSRQLSRSRPDLQKRLWPAAAAHDVRLGQARDQLLGLGARQIRDHRQSGAPKAYVVEGRKEHSTPWAINRRICAAARSWAPIRRPAR